MRIQSSPSFTVARAPVSTSARAPAWRWLGAILVSLVACSETTPTDGALPHSVVDAEYSDALNRIVLVDGHPNRLYVLDPETRKESFVELPVSPTCVAVSNDGTTAVVGNDGKVTIVDLAAMKVTRTIDVAITVGDIILPPNGYAYAVPDSGSYDGFAINLQTGAATKNDLNYWSSERKISMHPNGKIAYGISNYSSYLYRFSFSEESIVFDYSSPYLDDHDVCGIPLVSQDGARIFTTCGPFFRTAEAKADDMAYAGTLEAASYDTVDYRNPYAVAMDHSMTKGRLVAIAQSKNYYDTIDEDEVGEQNIIDVRFYSDATGTLVRSVSFKDSLEYRRGRFVFFNSTGTRVYALLDHQDPYNRYGMERPISLWLHTLDTEGESVPPPASIVEP